MTKLGVRKLRVLGLPDGEEIMTLAFFVLTQYRRVTDRWTDGHVAVAIAVSRVITMHTHYTRGKNLLTRSQAVARIAGRTASQQTLVPN